MNKKQAEVKVPSMGESITEATIARWLKKEGDAVAMDEPVAELETDKVTLEIGSPVDGVLTKVLVQTGTTVEVGAIIGQVTEGNNQKEPEEPKEEKEEKEPKEKSQPVVATHATEEAKLSPAVRKIVAEEQIDPRQIEGQGKGGRLTKGDVLAFLDKGQVGGETEAPFPIYPQHFEEPGRRPSGEPDERSNLRDQGRIPKGNDPGTRKAVGIERVHMSRLRQRIAERLKEAQNTAAILTTFNEADMTQIMALRNKLKLPFEKKHGIKLGFMPFFIKACIVALKEIPAVNAEIEGDDLLYKNYYDIGVAVGTPQGLVVPVVRDAHLKGFAEIEKEISALSQKARDGKLLLQDLQGGTFTISNGGVYGSLMSTPILNPPQSGILGMHKIQERPVVHEGKIEIRSMMYLALSYDHRVVDGREAVTFLVRVKECLEDPERILLDA